MKRAAAEEKQAVRLEPHGLWPNFYRGLCAYREGHYAEAALAYSVCIGAAPDAAGCFYNRALAFTALGQQAQALADYDRALQLDPKLAAAALNRGMLHYRGKRYALAAADLRHAAVLGADPALVHYDLALVELGRGKRARRVAKPAHHAPIQPCSRGRPKAYCATGRPLRAFGNHEAHFQKHRTSLLERIADRRPLTAIRPTASQPDRVPTSMVLLSDRFHT